MLRSRLMFMLSLAIMAGVAWLLSMPAQAQGTNPRRVALVIGNDNYQNVTKLQKAGNDAVAMARELRAAGFDVTLARDLNYRGMVRTVEAFTAKLSGGDQVAVFFAGHGVQVRSGSYLLPVDIEAVSESEIEKTAYSLNELTEKLGEAKAAFTLVMVDACRDNPLKTNGRSIGAARGLAAVEPPKGQIVVYSASRGQQALDSLGDKDPNPNGVFTREFIKRMRQPGLRIEDVVREVRDSVEATARSVNHEQRPAIYNEARGNFYFYAPVAGQAAAVAPAPVAPGPTETVAAALPAAPQPAAPQPALPAAPAREADSPLAAAFLRSPLAASTAPADSAAVARMLQLPAGEERRINANGHEAVLALVASDPWFKANPGTAKYSGEYFLAAYQNMKMARTCSQNGNLAATTLDFGSGASIQQGTSVLGGLLVLDAAASSRGYTGKATTRITGVERVWGQPFPLTPGKRFGIAWVTTRADGIGKFFGTDDSQARWQINCSVTQARSPNVPEGAQQIVCLQSAQGAQGIWTPVRRLYLDEASGSLADTQ